MTKTKQKLPGISSFYKRKTFRISNAKLGLLALVLLTLLAAVATWSNVFAYEYHYLKCGGAPLEVRGQYYRASGDEGYGIHHGSDYSHCLYETPAGVQRDPSTKIGAAWAQQRDEQFNPSKYVSGDYDIYVPNGYKISAIRTWRESPGHFQTSFQVTSETQHQYTVNEVNRDSTLFTYANVCTNPKDANWSGTVIGQVQGDAICKVNPSKYVTAYIAAAKIGRTSITLQALGRSANQNLDAEVEAIFGSMKQYTP